MLFSSLYLLRNASRWEGKMPGVWTYWLNGCNSAIYTGASNRTVRIREPSFKSHKTHFQSWDELKRYRPSRDQLLRVSFSTCTCNPRIEFVEVIVPYLSDWICLLCPRNLRATPFVSTSNITMVPSTYERL